MSNTCTHIPILDHSTGTEVCTHCGLVLNENLYYDEIHSNIFKQQSEKLNISYLIDDIDTIISFTQKRFELSVTIPHNRRQIPQKYKMFRFVFCF